MSSQNLKFRVDLLNNKIYYDMATGYSFEGTFSATAKSASITIVDSGSSTIKMSLKFKTLANGNLALVTVATEIKQASVNTFTVTQAYSDEGEYTAFSLNEIAVDSWRMIGFSKVSESTWSALGLFNDMGKKEFSFYRVALNAQDVMSYHQGTMTERQALLDGHAQVKSVVDMSSPGSYVLMQYVKNGGDWSARFTARTNAAGGYDGYIIDDGVERLFVSQQTVEIDGRAYTAAYEQTNINGRETMGLTFRTQSDPLAARALSQSEESAVLTLDFSETDVMVVGGKRYQIFLGADGKLSAGEIKAYDFDGDNRMTKLDVTLMRDKVKAGVYEAKFDVNSDGLLNEADLEMAADAFVGELQKSASVLVVEPGQSILAAQEEARGLIAAGLSRDVHVLVKSGDYYGTNLVFDNRDSGNNGYTVHYEGYPGHNAPRLIGGSLLDNAAWQRVSGMSGEVYRMSLSGVQLAGGPVTSLFVNGLAASNSDSYDNGGWDYPNDIPNENPILALYPNAVFRAGNGEGITTKVGTYLPDNNYPSWEESYPIRIDYVKQPDNSYRSVIRFYTNDGTTVISTEERAGLADRVAVINEYKQTKGMKAVQIASYQAFRFGAGALPANFDIVNAKAYFWCNKYTLQEIKIKHVDWNTRTVILDDVFGHAIVKNLAANGTYVKKSSSHKFSIKNSMSFLSAGEFYYDGAGGLYYSVRPGESLNNLKFSLPSGNQVLRVEGSIANPAHDIVFDGLDVSGSRAIDQVKDLYANHSMITVMPEEFSAIHLNNVRNVTIRNSKIHDTGSIGIGIRGVSENVQIVDNELFNIGADGIVLNGDDPGSRSVDRSYFPRHLSKNNLIQGNHIHHAGVLYQRGQGIWIVQSSGNRILNNRIHDIGYNGVYLMGVSDNTMGGRGVYRSGSEGTEGYNVRYTWNYTFDNLISGNDISHVTQKADDGGAIYTYSAGKNNEISYNQIHDIYSGVRAENANIGSFGVYLDTGQSDFFKIHHNNFYNFNSTTGMPMTINGSNNVITHNTMVINTTNFFVQFQFSYFNENNVFEHNTMVNRNTTSYRTIKVIYYSDPVPYTLGDPLPAGAQVVRRRSGSAPPYTYSYVYYPFVSQLASSNHNVYYNASGSYSFYASNFQIDDYVDVPGQPEPVTQVYQKAWIPIAEWQSTPVRGATHPNDINSTFGVMPLA